MDPGLAGAGQVSLTTHIAEATAAIMGAGEPVVLVGHSYGGSVITGAADQVPDHVRALVYLDAFVPDDGDSCWTMTNDEQRSWYIDGDEDELDPVAAGPSARRPVRRARRRADSSNHR